jgi:DNA gyrase/topoisomerase IV subunit A
VNERKRLLARKQSTEPRTFCLVSKKNETKRAAQPSFLSKKRKIKIKIKIKIKKKKKKGKKQRSSRKWAAFVLLFTQNSSHCKII